MPRFGCGRAVYVVVVADAEVVAALGWDALLVALPVGALLGAAVVGPRRHSITAS